MKTSFKNWIYIAALLILSGCRDNSKFDEIMPVTPPPTEQTPQEKDYDELYRPQIHFTPSRNWINDPNGLVYANGIYHMFYQYNPQGNSWGNMSWGHAISKDLIHWEEKPVALLGDDLGAIFSGSAVIDEQNTSGFGKDALVAIYTSAGNSQQQSIAYSTDNGETFKKFEANPVIANSSKPDYRDPKVFWHEESGSWIMSLALGWSYGIELLSSKDLKNWKTLSVFSIEDAACNRGQWECPDLLCFDYKGQKKWVMIVSVNPGGPVAGSGTMYFIGSFDGTQFIPDNLDYPMWLDHGADNYAGVTWSNIPDRTIYIGWMNNWLYSGDVPCSPWRSAMTLPRELSLVEVEGRPVLASKVIKEIENIAGEWKETDGEDFGEADAYHVRLTLDMNRPSTYRLGNNSGEYLELVLNSANRILTAKRNGNTGTIAFSTSFSFPSVRMPLYGNSQESCIDIYIDRSSVEIISADGTSAMTMLVFPKEIYNRISSQEEVKAQVRKLSRIWN